MKTESKFVHRTNGDGTYDSICMHCYLTVVTAGSNDDLTEEERRHECEDGHISEARAMSGLRITPPVIEHWRSRSLQILSEIRTLEAERQKPLSIKGPDSPTEIDDVVIEKIRELRAELKDIQSRLIRATYNDPS